MVTCDHVRTFTTKKSGAVIVLNVFDSHLDHRNELNEMIKMGIGS